ncbi:MAG: hypothetical protein ACI4QY_01260 [Oscillospiraceae bacterium]
MNIVMCSENCAHQKDGYCMLDDLAHSGGSASAHCKYFRQR